MVMSAYLQKAACWVGLLTQAALDVEAHPQEYLAVVNLLWGATSHAFPQVFSVLVHRCMCAKLELEHQLQLCVMMAIHYIGWQ